MIKKYYILILNTNNKYIVRLNISNPYTFLIQNNYTSDKLFLKMLVENSANYSCDKVLFVLKNSNLNYLLNETPYSAYITIRKKFVKDKAGLVLDS